MRKSESRDNPVQYAAIVAHQMKSPVVAISSLLAVLLDGTLGGLNANQRDFLSRARTRCTEAIAAISRLLEIGRPVPEGQAPEIVDMVQTAARFETAFRTQAAERQISLSLVATDSLRVAIRESVLVEVLFALVGNATKYTPERGQIRMVLRREADQAVLSVEDSGIGVSEQERDRLFQPFHRSKQARDSARPGVGLGLYFVKTMVESAAGSVSVDTGELGGARFTVRLPARPRSEDGRTVLPGEAVRRRVIIVGGAAAGPKIASRISRIDPTAEVTIVERGRHLAFAGCGLPYYVSGAVRHRRELMSTAAGALRDPIFFHAVKNVKVRLRAEAVEIDRPARRLRVRDPDSLEEAWLDYDTLVLTPGARARQLGVSGEKLANIFSLHGLEDADGIRVAVAQSRALDVIVVGGGLLGVEITEALVAKGSRVTIVEAADHILSILDEEIARLVERQLESHGVRVMTKTAVEGFAGETSVERVITSRGTLAADLVILSAGVEPNVELARAAGLALGPSGGLAVDEQMRTSDPHIFAAGDCVEAHHLLLGEPRLLPMGSTANKQGRVAAGNICGRTESFPGVLGTVVCRVFDWCVARTGLSETAARAAGHIVVTALVPGPDRAHYMPEWRSLYLKLVVDAESRRLLGVQALGPGAADKRVDVAATAIALGATVDQVANLDLAYAPPYSEALDNLHTAANVVRNKLDGLLVGITPKELMHKLSTGEPVLLLDVRSPAEHEQERLPGSMLVPLGSLRGRLQDLPRDREIVVFCNLSLRGYEAQIVLRAAGFERVFVLDGGLEMWPYEKVTA
jgi:NADPH-dependent 2,4-dienoyl-CoA reductase/sulfur reductase-like enzyme/rhodanese-related sulfurtransferase